MHPNPEPLSEVLDAIDEYLDQRADADHNGHSYVANEEMVLRQRLTESRAQDAGQLAAANKIIAEQSAVIASLAQGLMVSCAALQNVPEIGAAYTAEQRTAHAYALAAAQAGVALAEGRPFDPKGTELVVMLNSARDAIEFLLTRAEFRRYDERAFASAELALVALTRIVGPGEIERKVARFVDAYPGKDHPA